MGMAGKNCCNDETGCPHAKWIDIWRWVGDARLFNNLRSFPGHVWKHMKLDSFQDSVWQWRVVVIGTGDVADGTELFLAQNRKTFKKWIAPLNDKPKSVHYTLKFGGIDWADSTLTGAVTGGSFKITVTIGGVSQNSPPILWNATASDIQTALQTLDLTDSGTLNVNGGPLPTTDVGISFSNPRKEVTLSATSHLIGSSPSVTSTTTQDGSVGQDETQMLDFDWPATSGSFTISVTAKGSTQTTNPLAWNDDVAAITTELENLLNINPGDVLVARTAPATVGLHDRIYVTFRGSLGGTNIAPMTTTSALGNKPTVSLTVPQPGDVHAFRNEFAPLNVGTTWNGHIRKAYGNVEARKIRSVQQEIAINPDPVGPPGSLIKEKLDPGYGVIFWYGCGDRPPSHTQWGVKGLNNAADFATAEFDEESGEIVVTSSQPVEFALQIRCVSCHHDASFNLWGIQESNELFFRRIYDPGEPVLYDPDGGFTCGEEGVCRSWAVRENNIPYVLRKKFGPDGYDASFINDRFFAQKGKATRKPPCKPDVVAFGDGFWLQKFYSMKFRAWECDELRGTLKPLCDHKWKEEYSEESPTLDIERLKQVYGTSFSYWGAWIHQDSFDGDKIKCLFDEFDLTDIKVMFLGGLPVGRCPQTGALMGKQFTPVERDERYNSWLKIIHHEFEDKALDPLKKWLSLGGRVLVMDGGMFPSKFLETMGLTSRVETFADYGPHQDPAVGSVSPDTLNGSLFSVPVWGPELPDWSNPATVKTQFEPLHVDPEKHPFTSGIRTDVWDSSSKTLNANSNEGSLLAAIRGSSVAGMPLGGPVLPSFGVFNISQKGPTDGFTWQDKPAGGLRTYTTAAGKVEPGSGAVVVARVKGVVAVSPWYNSGTQTFVTSPVNYPAIVAEPWDATFRLRFVFSGSSVETSDIPYNADATQIKNALEALPNIGAGLTVLGGPLPNSVDIHFNTTLTSGVDVPQLEVNGADSIHVRTLQNGGSGVNEKQRLKKGKTPSRVLISNVIELVEPDAWGQNWADLHLTPIEADTSIKISQLGDNEAYRVGIDVAGHCFSYKEENFCVDGYGWGKGLSSIASTKFLQNILEHIGEF